MSLLGTDLEAVFHDNHALLSIARLRQDFRTEVTEVAHRSVFRIDNVAVAFRLEAVWNNVHSAEVGHINVSRTNDLSLLASRNVAEASCDAGEAGDHALVERANHENLGITTLSPHSLNDLLQDGFRERTSRTSDRSRGRIAVQVASAR